jgi:uncharacterized protein
MPNKKTKHSTKHEVRIHAAPQKFEVRKNADGTQSIGGYAAVFDSLSQDLGGFREKLQPGCFAKSLAETYKDPLCLYGHDMNQILGRVSSGTLSIAEDSRGLRFSCKLPDTSTARDLIALMERGDVSQMSFGFSVPEGGDDWDEVGGQIVRTLLQVVLYEISVVGQPAYTSTSVNLRSVPKALRSKLKRKADDDEDDLDVCNPDSPDYDPDACDDDSEEDRCSCECDECEAGNCDECTNPGCDDEDCEGCPGQTRAAHTRLLLARLRS